MLASRVRRAWLTFRTAGWRLAPIITSKRSPRRPERFVDQVRHQTDCPRDAGRRLWCSSSSSRVLTAVAPEEPTTPSNETVNMQASFHFLASLYPSYSGTAGL